MTAFTSSLQWKWFGALAGALLLMLVSIHFGFIWLLEPHFKQELRNDLKRESLLLRAQFEPMLEKGVSELEIHELARRLGKTTGLRITVILPDGRVIAESEWEAGQLHLLENHRDRPEIRDALDHGESAISRYSETLGMDMDYVALRLGEDPVQGVIRVSTPHHERVDAVGQFRSLVFWTVCVMGVVCTPVMFWLARSTSVPIESMRRMALEVAQGNFLARAPLEGSREIVELGGALNAMARQLEAKLDELKEERMELQATLTQMIEGVAVLDSSGKIRMVNRALRNQFQLSESVKGMTVMEVFRNPALREVVASTLKGENVEQPELSFYGAREKTFQVNAALLQQDGKLIGAVLVFHDITRLKQLENIRKDFVANVSHELRTPLSIIKGYLETLLEDPPPDRVHAVQFLRTIQRHSNRLQMLIDDILTISSLESQQSEMQREWLTLKGAAQMVVEEMSGKASGKKIQLQNQIPAALRVQADSLRLHQVFVNLVDNAIKYSPDQSVITLSAVESEQNIEVRVKDNGPGISEEHLPHLFERFYRVDRARSREEGGTGLGLSIVKHVVQAHQGRVWVTSEVGEGSTFHFTLPKLNPAN